MWVWTSTLMTIRAKTGSQTYSESQMSIRSRGLVVAEADGGILVGRQMQGSRRSVYHGLLEWGCLGQMALTRPTARSVNGCLMSVA